jgi:hypothetical protein
MAVLQAAPCGARLHRCCRFGVVAACYACTARNRALPLRACRLLRSCHRAYHVRRMATTVGHRLRQAAPGQAPSAMWPPWHRPQRPMPYNNSMVGLYVPSNSCVRLPPCSVYARPSCSTHAGAPRSALCAPMCWHCPIAVLSPRSTYL